MSKVQVEVWTTKSGINIVRPDGRVIPFSVHPDHAAGKVETFRIASQVAHEWAETGEANYGSMSNDEMLEAEDRNISHWATITVDLQS